MNENDSGKPISVSSEIKKKEGAESGRIRQASTDFATEEEEERG